MKYMYINSKYVGLGHSHCSYVMQDKPMMISNAQLDILYVLHVGDQL